MPHSHFHILDVFAEGPYAGNQLAVMPEGHLFGEAEMQKIARAFNFAETTFVCGGSVASGFDVRIFTPSTELPFAGHPTLGTAWLLREQMSEPTDTITLNLRVGKIPVEFGVDGVAFMTQQQPEFLRDLDQQALQTLLGLGADAFDDGYPIEEVSTGIPFIIVPLKDHKVLKQISLNHAGWSQLGRAGVLAFSTPGYDPDQALSARMFAGPIGVVEDAATGSANGCLAAWLQKHSYLGGSDVNIRVGQGYEIERPSQLYLKASGEVDNMTIKVGGRVNSVAEGQWKVA